MDAKSLGFTWAHTAVWPSSVQLPTLHALYAEGAVLHRQANRAVRTIVHDDQRVLGHGQLPAGTTAQHTLLGNCFSAPSEWVWPLSSGWVPGFMG